MGEEINNLKRRGGLLEDGVLLVPVMRKEQGVPEGSVSQCMGHGVCGVASRIGLNSDLGGMSGRVYLRLLSDLVSLENSPPIYQLASLPCPHK